MDVLVFMLLNEHGMLLVIVVIFFLALSKFESVEQALCKQEGVKAF